YNQSGMDRDAAQVWMPNVNVAHAVYARAAITKQDYTKALSEAKLARQNYPLMSNAEYQSGFCNPTSEWIFGCFGGSQENNWYWSYGTQFACNG
ncbi:UNVERIFIED_CONTAM: RagB/SusD family nutrient uptake outer membrane protein, partial [Bacteroidetes bacterium 56_B9]